MFQFGTGNHPMVGTVLEYVAVEIVAPFAVQFLLLTAMVFSVFGHAILATTCLYCFYQIFCRKEIQCITLCNYRVRVFHNQ